MQCASNYMWEDVRERANHGLLGGVALASVHIPEDAMEAAGFDEGNAFTSVEVPDWMTYWVCAPPVRAALVWDLLPTKIRQRLRPGNWTFPRYTRLAMGSSHSVRVIMSINITVIGRSLVASRRLGTFDREGTAEDESDEGEGVDLSDLVWKETCFRTRGGLAVPEESPPHQEKRSGRRERRKRREGKRREEEREETREEKRREEKRREEKRREERERERERAR